MENRYPGKCGSCGELVVAGAGTAYKRVGGWNVACRSEACHRKLGLAVGAEPRELRADGTVVAPYDPAALPLVKSFPGARWDAGAKVWRISLADEDRARVLEIAAKLDLKVAPELTTVVVSEQKTVAVARAAALGLYPFQIAGVEWLVGRNRGLLADDLGTGKTVQALCALPVDGRTIVVAPAAVKYNWKAEANKWRPDLAVVVLEGRKSFRLPEPGEIVIVNYDILPAWLLPVKTGEVDLDGKEVKRVAVPEEFKSVLAETTLIADEAHLVKSHKAQRSKKLRVLGQFCIKVWLLTGTPLTNNPFDLWGVLSVGGIERDVFGSWGKFLKLFGATKDRWGGYHFGGPAPEVPELLRRATLRRTKAEVLPELPRKRYQEIAVGIESDALVEDLERLEDRVREYGDELPPFELFSGVRAKLAADRIPAVLELVGGYEEAGQPVVVFSAHRAPIDVLAARDGWAVITGDTKAEDRTNVVRRFQAGELKGIGCTIQAGGVGLTLTRANHSIFVDLDWTPAWNVQAEDRICRIGQTADSIVITRLVSNHRLERHVHKLLAEKIALIQAAIEQKIEFAPKPERDLGLVPETDEELAARLAEIGRVAKDITEREAREKVASILERESGRASGRPAPKLTAERKARIKAALEFLAGRCDGAVDRDDRGFNKPDAAIGHWLVATGLHEDDDTSYRVAERILARYSRQLDSFADIWNGCAA